MKRTTYILIGVFFANILVVLAIILYIRVNLVSYDELRCKVDFSGETTSLDLADVHSLEFTTSVLEDNDFYFSNHGKVQVTPSSTGEERIVYPVSDYLKLDKKDGILKVTIDLSKVERGQTSDKQAKKLLDYGLSLEKLSLQVETGRMLKRVYGHEAFNVSVKHMTLDSLRLQGGSIQVDSCVIGFLMIEDKLHNLQGKSSKISDLRIDLDGVHHWRLQDYDIETLYLTGTGKQWTELSQNDYKKLVWIPKNKDAELSISLKGAAEVISEN